MRKATSVSVFFIALSLLLSCKSDDPAVQTTFDMLLDAPVAIAAGEETYVYVYKESGVAETRYASKISITVSDDINEVKVNRFTSSPLPTLNEPRKGAEDFNNHTTIAMARKSHTFSFPSGVGLKINSNEKFDIGMKVINVTATSINSLKSSVTFEAPATTITHEALPFTFYNGNVNMPAGSTGTITTTFTATEKWHLVMMTSFASKFITNVKVSTIKGGTITEVYNSTDWEDPLVKSLDAIALNVGDGLRLEADYNNTSSQPVRFGNGSNDDFTGVFAYYYRD
jgi:hypothetical protein